MTILVEFVDCDEETEEYEGSWGIKDSCLVIYEMRDKLIQTVIPLHNIFRMSEYKMRLEDYSDDRLIKEVEIRIQKKKKKRQS